MQTFVTILVANYALDVSVLKARLESEGIACFLEDEMINQINPLYTAATGGIKLKVRRQDYAAALEVLMEGGYEVSSDLESENSIVTRLITVTEKIPLLGKIGAGKRFFWLFIIVLAGVSIGLFFGLKPSIYESLTKTKWCVKYIDNGGEIHAPYTTRNYAMITFAGECTENIDFIRNFIFLPGINSRGVQANWFIDEKSDKLIIQHSDTLGGIYNKSYEVDISKGILTLSSEETVIKCYATGPKY